MACLSPTLIYGEKDKEVDWLGKHVDTWPSIDLASARFKWQQLETTVSGVTPEAVYTEPRKPLALDTLPWSILTS